VGESITNEIITELRTPGRSKKICKQKKWRRTSRGRSEVSMRDDCSDRTEKLEDAKAKAAIKAQIEVRAHKCLFRIALTAGRQEGES